ncbi:HalOD1 output domain-containing protein [Halorubrum depositum]|uniref:HalOD1 output domain-containing protein n=1 Tax=Halorubrum depositum TaxID=2583992 RepID=UPI0011A6F364|nr:HalOD1 output domain-containing protein [Halorubrum depositum]
MSSVPTSASDAASLPGPVRVAHGCDDRPASRAVVEAVADLAGVAPDGLADEADIVLYDHVDLDALDALVEHRADGGVSLSFSVAEYDVRVDDDEAVARVTE